MVVGGPRRRHVQIPATDDDDAGCFHPGRAAAAPPRRRRTGCGRIDEPQQWRAQPGRDRPAGGGLRRAGAGDRPRQR
ncbi:hypothetical protein G6F24_017407 [Rhizopus arrhizus]|nr:hypothetical protein G6F24_017407 [Rhizopus arrhizus]